MEKCSCNGNYRLSALPNPVKNDHYTATATLLQQQPKSHLQIYAVAGCLYIMVIKLIYDIIYLAVVL